jgi:hypothetical protein
LPDSVDSCTTSLTSSSLFPSVSRQLLFGVVVVKRERKGREAERQEGPIGIVQRRISYRQTWEGPGWPRDRRGTVWGSSGRRTDVEKHMARQMGGIMNGAGRRRNSLLTMQVTLLTPGQVRSKLARYPVDSTLTIRYAYYNSKEGHHAAHEAGGH